MAVNTVIATNLIALNTNRQLGSVAKKRERHSNRLSSGSKINTASEDAAGVTISEKMQAQIRGLNVAEKNTEDAISLIETMDGAYSEVHDMLQRCRELLVQSINDTNSDEDRKRLMQEVNELIEEIEVTFERTEFNGKTITELNNSLIQLGANVGHSISLTGLEVLNLSIYDKVAQEKITKAITEVMLPAVKELADINISGHNGVGTTFDFNNGVASFNIADCSAYIKAINDSIGSINTVMFSELDGIISTLSSEVKTSINKAIEDTKQEWQSINGRITTAIITATSSGNEAVFPNGIVTVQQIENMFNNPGDKVIIRKVAATTLSDELKASITKFSDEFYSLGEEAFTFNVKDHLNFYLEGEAEFGIDEFNMYLEAFDGYISQVSDYRAELGAIQNRLGYSIESIKVSSENLYAANSQIQDADMAEEMMGLTSSNVLIQASTALLAQANSSKEGVLQLLQ